MAPVALMGNSKLAFRGHKFWVLKFHKNFIKFIIAWLQLQFDYTVLNTCKPTNLMNILIDLHFYCSYLHKNLLVIICLFYETISIPTVPIYL